MKSIFILCGQKKASITVKCLGTSKKKEKKKNWSWVYLGWNHSVHKYFCLASPLPIKIIVTELSSSPRI